MEEELTVSLRAWQSRVYDAQRLAIPLESGFCNLLQHPRVNRRVPNDAALPDLAFEWDVQMGAEELLRAYRSYGLTLEEFIGPRFTRLLHIRELMQAGLLDDDLRRRVPAVGR